MNQICFELDAERQGILDAADRYGRDRLYPLAARMDEEEWWPDEEFRALGRNGYLGITAPADLGGAGLDLFASGLVAEAFARWNPALALSWVAHENLCLNNLLRNGSDEQRRRWVPGLCDGSRIGCLALTEPGAGSDALGSMRMTARREGDHYVLNGRKLYITNGPVADVALVYAKTDPARGAHGISAFLVETDTPGFNVAQKLEKMGFRGSQTAELVFDDCRVPAECLVGEENEGKRVVMSGLDLERALVAPLAVGIAERALALAVEHAKTREQFGKPIGSFQMVQSRLADMYTRLEAMRTLQLPMPGRLQRPRARRRRARRDPQADRRDGDVHGRFLERGARPRRADPRRHGLHLGIRDQPPLPHDQAARRSAPAPPRCAR